MSCEHLQGFDDGDGYVDFLCKKHGSWIEPFVCDKCKGEWTEDQIMDEMFKDVDDEE